MDKAFRISVLVFVGSLISMITFAVAPEIPDYPSFTGLQTVITIVKILDAFDLPFTILSAFCSVITYLLKKR
jgi:hypothetical protein